MDNIAILGDCVEYMKTLPDNAFDLAVVDPVYGDVKKGGYMKNGTTAAIYHKEYNLALWKQEKTGQDYFDELFRVSKNQIIWGGNYFTKSINRDSVCWLVWDKLRGEGVTFAYCELAWTSFDTSARMFRFMWNGGNMQIHEDRIHPTQKPKALYDWIFKKYAKKGDRILDTHLGSGSSRLAAYDAGLDFVGIEINEGYYNDSVKRFNEYISQQSLFGGYINDAESFDYYGKIDARS